MKLKSIISTAQPILKKWWVSILLIPFIWFSLDQAYLTLRFNIFFSISYDFPFPVNFVHLMVDNFLLITHEAGHTFFSLFGWRTLTILGGSLFQIILPLLILGYFYINSIKTGIQMSLYLVGFSLVDVAFYVADAAERQLPLIGNLSKEYHDWYNLLSRWDAMEYHYTLALALIGIAILCYGSALLLPLFHQSYETKKIELDL